MIMKNGLDIKQINKIKKHDVKENILNSTKIC